MNGGSRGAAEGDQALTVAILAADPQKAMIQVTALEKVLELALHVVWQQPDLVGQ